MYHDILDRLELYHYVVNDMDNNVPPPIQAPPPLNVPLPPLNLPPPPVQPGQGPAILVAPHLIDAPPPPNNGANNDQRDRGPVEFVTMTGGGRKLCFEGHYYVRHKALVDGKVAYRCENCNGDRETKCYARLHERNGRCVFRSLTPHNHPPNAVKVFQLQVANKTLPNLTLKI